MMHINFSQFLHLLVAFLWYVQIQSIIIVRFVHLKIHTADELCLFDSWSVAIDSQIFLVFAVHILFTCLKQFLIPAWWQVVYAL
jgi:hypothetical protein